MNEQLTTIRTQGGGYGPPPGGYGPPMGSPGGFGPPQGGMPPMGGGGAAPPDLQAHISKWFTLSIVSIFCGCGLLGIINVLMANQAKEALARGDIATAQAKIGTARTLCMVGYGLVVLQVVFLVLWFGLGFVSYFLRH